MHRRPDGKRTLSWIAAVWLPLTFAFACDDATPNSRQDVAREPLAAAGSGDGTEPTTTSAAPASRPGPSGDLVSEGRNVFRFQTFGDEAFWGGKLRLHDAIKGESAGGTGPGISPKTALSLGLKVDVQELPRDLQRNISQGKVNLDDPAVTVALLKANAVIGLTGVFDNSGDLTSLGIQCALCHSIVDDSVAPGIGRRMDGWPNRDLDIGTIVAAAPDLTAFTGPLGVDDATLRSVLQGWGRGKFDAFVGLDGKATRPDGGSAAVLIPPLFGLQGVGLMTWNGWGGIGVWVPLVINLEMHGQGVYSDRRLNDAQFPIAMAQGYSRISNSPDLVTPHLIPLIAYVESLQPPAPARGSYDVNASKRGQALFTGKARCSGCHVPPLYTTPGWNLVPPATIGIDSFQADRSPNHGYRPPPLRGVQTRMKGGFFHDGRFATLNDVVDHFNEQFGLALADSEKSDLVEFLKTL
jgi:hypothetical protein